MSYQYHHYSGTHEEAHKEYINKYKMAHCIGVAEYMKDNAYKYGLDGNQMYILGLLHDVGYLEGRRGHEKAGGELLSSMGIKSDYIRAVQLHGTNPYTLSVADRENPFLILLYEADMSVSARGYRIGFEKRLEGIGKRYGFNGIEYETARLTVKYVKEVLSALK